MIMIPASMASMRVGPVRLLALITSSLFLLFSLGRELELSLNLISTSISQQNFKINQHQNQPLITLVSAKQLKSYSQQQQQQQQHPYQIRQMQQPAGSIIETNNQLLHHQHQHQNSIRHNENHHHQHHNHNHHPFDHQHQPFNICSMVPAHISSQLKMCKISQPNAMVAINNGALKGIAECQNQFQKERWNCSHPQGDHHLITSHTTHSVGNRESAFLHAITAAGIVHSIAKACSMGNMSDCACDKTQEGRTLDREKNWVWGGCHENVRYGMLYAKHFAEALEKMHNYLAQKNSPVNKVGHEQSTGATGNSHLKQVNQHLNHHQNNGRSSLSNKQVFNGYNNSKQQLSTNNNSKQSKANNNNNIITMNNNSNLIAASATSYTSKKPGLAANLNGSVNIESNYITRMAASQQQSSNQLATHQTHFSSSDEHSVLIASSLSHQTPSPSNVSNNSLVVSPEQPTQQKSSTKASANFIVVSDKVIKRRRRNSEPITNSAFRKETDIGISVANGAQTTFDEYNRDSHLNMKTNVGPSSICTSNNNNNNDHHNGGLFIDQQQQQQLMKSLMATNSLKYHQDIRQAMNMHNNKAGRLAVARNMELNCRCHGISGSCALTTCWRTLRSFSLVGDYLKRKYDTSILIPTVVQIQKLIAMMDKNEVANILQHHATTSGETSLQPQLTPSMVTITATVTVSPSGSAESASLEPRRSPATVVTGGGNSDNYVSDEPIRSHNNGTTLANDSQSIFVNSSSIPVISDFAQKQNNNCTQLMAIPSPSPVRRSGSRRHHHSGLSNQPTNNHFQHLNKEDLIHLHKSPDYCQPDPAQGIVGTLARPCSLAPDAPDSCDKLCCGRGYRKHTLRRSVKCNCRFQYCCSITCYTCEQEVNIYTCQ